MTRLITTLENYAAVLRELRRGDEAEDWTPRRSLRAPLVHRPARTMWSRRPSVVDRLADRC